MLTSGKWRWISAQKARPFFQSVVKPEIEGGSTPCRRTNNKDGFASQTAKMDGRLLVECRCLTL